MKRADGDDVALFRFSDAMPNGILYEGLQNESRDRTAGAIRINLKFKSKAVSKTSLLNADVVLDELNFAGERDFVRVHFIQRNAEQFTQAQEDILSSVGIFVDQGRSSLKRIEQEMRMKLGPQIFDLRFARRASSWAARIWRVRA